MYRYAEGAGAAATFAFIKDIDFLSSTELICSDKGNHCLRLVNFTFFPPQTYKFAGKCTQSGNVDGHRVNSALFRQPKNIEVNNDNLTLFVIDSVNALLRMIDLRTDDVTTLITLDPLGKDMKLIGSSMLYIAQTTRVTVYNLNAREKSNVAGEDSSGSAVGSFEDTRFNDAFRLLLWPDEVKVLLLVLDFTANRFASFLLPCKCINLFLVLILK